MRVSHYCYKLAEAKNEKKNMAWIHFEWQIGGINEFYSELKFDDSKSETRKLRLNLYQLVKKWLRYNVRYTIENCFLLWSIGRDSGQKEEAKGMIQK